MTRPHTIQSIAAALGVRRVTIHKRRARLAELGVKIGRMEGSPVAQWRFTDAEAKMLAPGNPILSGRRGDDKG